MQHQSAGTSVTLKESTYFWIPSASVGLHLFPIRDGISGKVLDQGFNSSVKTGIFITITDAVGCSRHPWRLAGLRQTLRKICALLLQQREPRQVPWLNDFSCPHLNKRASKSYREDLCGLCQAACALGHKHTCRKATNGWLCRQVQSWLSCEHMVTLESWLPQLLCKYLLFEKGWFRLPFQNQSVSDVLKKKKKEKKVRHLSSCWRSVGPSLGFEWRSHLKP